MRFISIAVFLGLQLIEAGAQTRPPIQKTPTVPPGKTSDVGFFYAIDPDCSGRGEIESRIIKAPQNGKVEINPGTNFPTQRDSGPYQACNSVKVPGMIVTY